MRRLASRIVLRFNHHHNEEKVTHSSIVHHSSVLRSLRNESKLLEFKQDALPFNSQSEIPPSRSRSETSMLASCAFSGRFAGVYPCRTVFASSTRAPAAIPCKLWAHLIANPLYPAVLLNLAARVWY